MGQWTQRIVQFRADTILAPLRVWNTFSEWASVLQRDVCAEDPTTLRTFTHEALAEGHFATWPLARFNTFKWLHSYVGFPCSLSVEDRPRMQWTNFLAGQQAAAAHLKNLIAVEEE